MSNANIADGRILDLYHLSLEDDQDPGTDELLEVYQEVGVHNARYGEAPS